MTPQLWILATGIGFLLAAVGASLLCLARVRAVLRAVPQTSASEAAVGILQQKLEALERDVRDLPRLAAAAGGGPPPRGAFNLEKRSHALRLHRRGQPLPGIAAALELPLQEVELLIKVHRIVLKNL